MNRAQRLSLSAVAALIVCAGLAAVVWHYRESASERENREVSVLRARRAVLRDSLAARLERDPVVQLAAADSADIAVALSTHVLVTLLHEVATRYLDRVEVDIEDLTGRGKGLVERDSPIGELTVGEWKVAVRVHQFGGVLSAGSPTVDVRADNRLHLELPARIREGEGSLTLAFEWNSKSIFNLVCRDFKTVQTLHGRMLPQRHVIRGDYVLAAGDEGIVAVPDFPREKFPLAMALDEKSWGKIRTALEEQDKVLKCGLLMNPDNVLEKLRALAARGLRFKLPRRMLSNSIRLPATIERSVHILDSSALLSVQPHQLRITPDFAWYSADVAVQRSFDLPPPPPTSSPAR